VSPQADLQVVEEMLAAQQAGRVDDMLARADPRIVVRPMTRPGHSVYIGHVEFKLLLTDVGRAWGKHRVQWSDITSTGDGTVRANGAVLMLANGAETEFTRRGPQPPPLSKQGSHRPGEQSCRRDK
jgi:hypothetical protein